METAGGRVFVNLSLESSAGNVANNRNTEKPKPRRKPTRRDTERLKTFNAKKAASSMENEDDTSEESSEAQNFSDVNGTLGNQRPTDEEKDIGGVSSGKNITEKPVEKVVVLDSKVSDKVPTKSDKATVPPMQMETKSGRPMTNTTDNVLFPFHARSSRVSVDRLADMERRMGMDTFKGGIT